jgi:hypothetical protein
VLAALVPLLAWIAATAWLVDRGSSRIGVRESALTAATLAAAWLVLGTELLGLWHALGRWTVLTWWLVPLVALVGALARRGITPVRPRLPRPSAAQWALAACIAVPLACAACQAWFAPPNTADALAYHLQRQVFWAQQASVEHYPTSALRQLVMPPLSEFAGLHLMLLSGSDAYHNLVQWLALGLTACAVSLIAERHGGGRTTQLVSALCVVTIPMEFVQASST